MFTWFSPLLYKYFRTFFFHPSGFDFRHCAPLSTSAGAPTPNSTAVSTVASVYVQLEVDATVASPDSNEDDSMSIRDMLIRSAAKSFSESLSKLERSDLELQERVKRSDSAIQNEL